MPTTPIACIFDMNGVIIDDVPYHILAWRKFFEQHGRELTDEQFTTTINGRTTPDICLDLLGRTPTKEEVLKLEAEKEFLYRELYRPHRKLVPGVAQFLEHLKQQNIPTAVATSAQPENVSPYVLEDLHVRQFFRAVIDASQVVKGKPDPEIYLKAAKAIEMDPARCFVFEDSRLGAQAAKAAGMKVVGILTTHTAEELPGSVMTARDFTEITLSKLRPLLG